MISLAFIWELTRRDFSDQFAGSVLGSLWALIKPMVNLVIYIVIFGKLMGGRLPGSSDFYSYAIYVTVGLLPWAALANSINRSSSIFLDKKHLIAKIRISLPSLVIYVILSEAVTFLISMACFVIFLLFSGYEFNRNLLLAPFIFYLQQLFAFGFGLMAATLTVFIKDVKEVIGVILQFWFWFTPIIYVRDILPDFAKKIMLFNPAYVIVESYQRIFVFNDDPAYRSLIILTFLTHLMILAAYWMFRVLEKDVRDFL